MCADVFYDTLLSNVTKQYRIIGARAHYKRRLGRYA